MNEESFPNSLKTISDIRMRYSGFIGSCAGGGGTFRLTPKAEITPFGLCFAVFGLHLLGAREVIYELKDIWAVRLRENIRSERRALGDRPTSKAYRQLLCFTLSALSAIGALHSDPLDDLVSEQLPRDIKDELLELGCLSGVPQSGNQAMFLAVFLIHARDYLGNKNADEALDRWVDLHFSHMNDFGFWGKSRGMTHLQFQNGYHQYEILEYLGKGNLKSRNAPSFVAGLADGLGHFAPYPGGGGCYDYDAVSLLTSSGISLDECIMQILLQTAASIVSEERPSGGFAESVYVRPRSLGNTLRFARGVASAAGKPSLFMERLKYAITLQRSVHNRIHTHWSAYSRSWDEADLWDSWFRIMTLARIEIACDPAAAAKWGFIDYPGIGFHPCLHGSARP
ncbi:MAG: hypothetical protein PHX43_03360 [Alphaproteobacteria bacterium]|nr:hypothetical protein [Alphaproteobacteria bacterium]